MDRIRSDDLKKKVTIIASCNAERSFLPPGFELYISLKFF